MKNEKVGGSTSNFSYFYLRDFIPVLPLNQPGGDYLLPQ